MSDPPRDWDRELANIDKAIAKQGATPAGSPPTAGAAPRSPAGVPAPRRRSVALAWFWVLLAVALAAALPLWPYEKTCGLQLFFFLGAAGITIIVGVLGALSSWAHRRGFAHLLALTVLAWAGILTAREVLPRIGYAKESRTWMCPSEAPSAAPAPTPKTP
ncbi:MAG TPA: hypothetical protein VHR41_03690 [Gemmatimonadales bacterium]|jgi:hypothetical protein|nr:hypothetical protein [Gemmatimonadales bacterium]